MTLTTGKGIRFPESNDHTRMYEHLQNLAEDVDLVGGIYVCTSTTRPGAPVQGQEIYETDTQLLRMWDGAAWQTEQFVGAWPTTWVPAITTGGTAFSPGNATISSRYSASGTRVTFVVEITMGSTTTFGSGEWSCSVPFAPKSGARPICNARAFDTSAGLNYTAMGLIQGTTASGAATHFAINGGSTWGATAPFTWAVGDTFWVSGTYEMA